MNAKTSLSALTVACLTAHSSCGPKHHRVEQLPGKCMPGEDVVREVTPSCGDERCTCTAAGDWQCISPPCTPPRPATPTCNPGFSFLDQVRHNGQLCSRRCVCQQQGSHQCDEFECVEPEGDTSTTVPVEGIPEPCRALECSSPSQLQIKQGDNKTVIGECVSADGSASPVRRVCYPEGHWQSTVVKGGGTFAVRKMFARDPGASQDRAIETSFSYRGNTVMTCVPLSTGHLDCRVAGSEVVAPDCWRKAHPPKNRIRVLSTAGQLAEFVSCKSAQVPVDWEHTRLLMLSQQSNDREQLLLKVRSFEGRTEVVALFEKQCEDHRREAGRVRREPMATQYRLLIPMLRDETELTARIEHAEAHCIRP